MVLAVVDVEGLRRASPAGASEPVGGKPVGCARSGVGISRGYFPMKGVAASGVTWDAGPGGHGA